MSERETVPAFTAFRRDDDGEICFLRSTQAQTVTEFMREVAEFYGTDWEGAPNLVAWAPLHALGSTCDRLCSESIAAGRLIEKVDGSWTARGAEEAPTEPAKAEAPTKQPLPVLDYFTKQQALLQAEKDRFPGFTVTGSGERNERSTGHFANHSSPDMNTSHQVAPMWGSADLAKR